MSEPTSPASPPPAAGSAPVDASAELRASQRPWVAGTLAGLSMGLYLLYYFYRYASDLKRAGQDVKPWLWALGALFGITWPFMASSLSGSYRALAEQAPDAMPERKAAPDRGGLLGGIALIAALISQGTDRLFPEASTAVMLVAFPILGICIAVLTRDLNHSRKALPATRFAPRSTGRVVGAWVWVLLTVPMWLFLIQNDARALLTEKIPQNEVWTHPGGLFELAPTDRWSVADLGTYSDGTALAEFASGMTTNLVVFDQSTSDSVDDVSEYRREAFLADFDGTCAEARSLHPDTLELRAELTCQESSLGTSTIMMSTVISRDSTMLEAVGNSQVASTRPGDIEEAIRRLRRVANDLVLAQ